MTTSLNERLNQSFYIYYTIEYDKTIPLLPKERMQKP